MRKLTTELEIVQVKGEKKRREMDGQFFSGLDRPPKNDKPQKT